MSTNAVIAALALAGAGYYWYKYLLPQSQFIMGDSAQVIELMPAGNGRAGQYQLPLSVIKRGGPETTSDRLWTPPVQRFETQPVVSRAPDNF